MLANCLYRYSTAGILSRGHSFISSICYVCKILPIRSMIWVRKALLSNMCRRRSGLCIKTWRSGLHARAILRNQSACSESLLVDVIRSTKKAGRSWIYSGRMSLKWRATNRHDKYTFNVRDIHGIITLKDSFVLSWESFWIA